MLNDRARCFTLWARLPERGAEWATEQPTGPCPPHRPPQAGDQAALLQLQDGVPQRAADRGELPQHLYNLLPGLGGTLLKSVCFMNCPNLNWNLLSNVEFRSEAGNINITALLTERPTSD